MDDFTTNLRITHDKDVDAAYVYLEHPRTPGTPVRTVPVSLPDSFPASILLDFDTDNRLIGIEVLGAAAGLPERLLTVSSPPPDSPRDGDPTDEASEAGRRI